MHNSYRLALVKQVLAVSPVDVKGIEARIDRVGSLNEFFAFHDFTATEIG